MKPKYRNVAFLAELLINIFVFSISCAILAGLFGRAALTARQTKEENFASTEIYTLFETMKARGTSALTVVAEHDGGGTYVCYYDRDWQPSVSSEPAYIITVEVAETDTGAGALCAVSATAATSAGEEIVTLETQTYQPSAEGGAV